MNLAWLLAGTESVTGNAAAGALRNGHLSPIGLRLPQYGRNPEDLQEVRQACGSHQTPSRCASCPVLG